MKTTIIGFITVIASISATVAFACCDMSGTTICGDGTGNSPVICTYFPPVISNCTGSSTGVPEREAGYAESGGYPLPGAGGCLVTVTYESCCDGAITSGTGFGYYLFIDCAGSSSCGG